MDANELQRDIKNQLSEVNKTMPKYKNKSYNNSLMGDNINSLEYTLKGALRNFRLYKIISMAFLAVVYVLSFISLVFSSLKLYQGVDIIDMHKYEYILNINNFIVLIFVSFPGLINAFRLQKIIAYLEKKILLLRLLDKMDNI